MTSAREGDRIAQPVVDAISELDLTQLEDLGHGAIEACEPNVDGLCFELVDEIVEFFGSGADTEPVETVRPLAPAGAADPVDRESRVRRSVEPAGVSEQIAARRIVASHSTSR